MRNERVRPAPCAQMKGWLGGREFQQRPLEALLPAVPCVLSKYCEPRRKTHVRVFDVPTALALVVVDEAHLLGDWYDGARTGRRALFGWAMRRGFRSRAGGFARAQGVSLTRRGFRGECAPGVLDFLDWRRKHLPLGRVLVHASSLLRMYFSYSWPSPNEHTRIGQRLAAPSALVGHEVQGQDEGEHEGEGANVKAGEQQQVQAHVDICQVGRNEGTIKTSPPTCYRSEQRQHANARKLTNPGT